MMLLLFIDEKSHFPITIFGLNVIMSVLRRRELICAYIWRVCFVRTHISPLWLLLYAYDDVLALSSNSHNNNNNTNRIDAAWTHQLTRLYTLLLICWHWQHFFTNILSLTTFPLNLFSRTRPHTRKHTHTHLHTSYLPHSEAHFVWKRFYRDFSLSRHNWCSGWK